MGSIEPLRKCFALTFPIVVLVGAGTMAPALSGPLRRGGDAPRGQQPALEALADKVFLGDFEPPPGNDICESAAVLSLSMMAQGTTHDATPNYDSGLETCTSYTQAGPDVAYSIVMVSGQSYTVTMTPEASFDASISLLGPGTASVCNAMPVTCLIGADSGNFGGTETFQFTPSQTGTYFIIVDSYYTGGGADASGSFSIEVSTP